MNYRNKNNFLKFILKIWEFLYNTFGKYKDLA